ncbi:MAG: sigma-70 family RNA polymerase sigma factor [Bryobacteraceae bacterium]
MTSPGEVTHLLAELKLGNREALAQLTPLVYKELRRLAGYYLRNERTGHTLQPTALVHEAFLRLAGLDRMNWQNRSHFMAMAAGLMRRVLVDYARQRKAAKRGIPVAITVEGRCGDPAQADLANVLAVDEALTRLCELDPQQCRVVELRYFGGMTVEEAAEALEISPRTVKRDWAMAKAWLHTELARTT